MPRGACPPIRARRRKRVLGWPGEGAPGALRRPRQARSIAYLFATGAALGLLTVAVPHPSEVNDLALVLLASAAIVIAAIVWLSRDRLREWHIHAVLLAAR